MFTIHKAAKRGGADHGWLKTKHSFSFAGYHDPEKMGFGKLRVLNDDIIAAGKGFDTHPHADMEIITVVTKGELLHQDDTGTRAVLKPGDVQVMSAGTGIKHSEHNNSKEESLELFQLWILPDRRGVAPRHEEMHYEQEKNAFTTLASGDAGGIPIHQEALVAIGTFTEPHTYAPTQEGTYLLIVEGAAAINGHPLGQRDAVEITDERAISIDPHAETTILLIDTAL